MSRLSPIAILSRMADARENEIRALAWSFAYFFFLLCAYYVLRPLRDDMGIIGGVRNLQWLFTATFLAMLVAVPAFGWLVSRFSRRRIIPIVYRFFIANILIFYALMAAAPGDVILARVFFVWVSLFNLFVVSVFWSFMADLWSNEQGRRLFGFIAAGGSAGALAGPVIAASLAEPLGPVSLLLISAAVLELSVQCVFRLRRVAGQASGYQAAASSPAGGGIFAGIVETARSPYLMGICLYILLFTTLSTFLYFLQANIVADAFEGSAARTKVFALIDLAVSGLTIVTQIAVTGRLARRIGVGGILAFLPVVTVVGFALLAIAPVVAILVGFQALRRASNFAISRPGREMLFTAVSPEQKYKSKNFIDTAVYRGGDAVAGWAFAGLRAGGLDIAGIAAASIPLALIWVGLALGLGRARDRRIARSEPSAKEILREETA
jgi:ATP:ADP antiporter, AAA family